MRHSRPRAIRRRAIRNSIRASLFGPADFQLSDRDVTLIRQAEAFGDCLLRLKGKLKVGTVFNGDAGLSAFTQGPFGLETHRIQRRNVIAKIV